MGISAAGWRIRHAERLSSGGEAVRGHRGGRQRQECDKVRRLDHRVCAAGYRPNRTAPLEESNPGATAESDGQWINLFDGSTLNGWVHLNGAHTFSVEDGAIVGRTVESSAAMNSFLCTTREFGDFELELETMIDPVTNSGIQIRSTTRRNLKWKHA